MKLIKETRKKLQDKQISIATGMPMQTVISHTSGKRKKKNQVLEKYFIRTLEDAFVKICEKE